jgi:hypothetical protein
MKKEPAAVPRHRLVLVGGSTRGKNDVVFILRTKHTAIWVGKRYFRGRIYCKFENQPGRTGRTNQDSGNRAVLKNRAPGPMTRGGP